MSTLRVPFETLSVGQPNAPLRPQLSLDTANGVGAVPIQRDDKTSTLSSLHLLLGHAAEKVDRVSSEEDDYDCPTPPAPASSARATPIRVPLRSYRSLHESDPSSEDETDESPTSLSEDSLEDLSRAMGFLKFRAPCMGMSQTMANALDAVDSDSEESDWRAVRAMQKVISTVSTSPLALERHISQSSMSSDDYEDDLTDEQRDELDMVMTYMRQWGSNVKLDTTHWQGMAPRHLIIEVTLRERLTVYQAEQAIKAVSAQIGLPPPLDVQHDAPRLDCDVVLAGVGRLAEYGWLMPRPSTTQPSPQTILNAAREALNEAREKGKEVVPVPVRLQAGAKLAAGRQKPEATARRMDWEPTPSKHREDITALFLVLAMSLDNDDA